MQRRTAASQRAVYTQSALFPIHRPARYPNDHMCPEGQALAFEIFRAFIARWPRAITPADPLEQLYCLTGKAEPWPCEKPEGVPS